MPRGLSAAAKNYSGPIVWLADITTRGGAKHYFAEDQVRFAGNDYLPYLRLRAGPRLTRSLQTDAAELELLNADAAISTLTAADEFDAALCELKQFLIGLDTAVLIFRGRLTEQEETDLGVRFRLVSELDPAQIDIHARFYAPLCTWRFSQPGRLTPCGYNPAAVGDVAEALFGERAANIFSATAIGDTTLNEATDAHKERIAVITAGSGRGQKRRIASNTATTFTLYHLWATLPDGSSKFRVFTLAAGAPRLLLTASSGKLESLATSATARSLTDTSLVMAADDHQDALLTIVSGAAAGQKRRIGSNTATVITLADDEPDFSPAPQASDKFRVLYRACPKDYAPSCEERARTLAFNGFPTLVPLLRRTYGGAVAPAAGGGGSRDWPPRRGAFIDVVEL